MERNNICLYIYTHTQAYIWREKKNFLDLANIQVLFKLSNLLNLVLKKSTTLLKQYKKANSDI